MNLKVGDKVVYMGRINFETDPQGMVTTRMERLKERLDKYKESLVASIISIDIKNKTATVRFKDNKEFQWQLDSMIKLENPSNVMLDILK